MHGIGVGQREGNNRVGRFVVGHPLFFVFVDHSFFLFEARSDPFDRLVKFLHTNGCFVVTGRQQRRLVHEACQISSAESRSDAGHVLDVHRRIELDRGHMHSQDCLAATHIGPVNQNMPVESARPQECWIERFWPVRGGHHNHATVAPKAIHLHEQGVERLFSLVVPAHHAGASRLAEGVEFVNKNNARGLRLGLLKHISHAGRPNAHEHLHEIRTGEAKKWHARLAGNRLGEQCFARAWRADQEHAFWNMAAEGLVFLGAPQKLHHFAKLFHGLVDACHIVERDAQILLRVHFPTAASKRHRTAGATQFPHHEEKKETKQAGQKEQGEPVAPRTWRFFVAERHAVFGQEPRELPLGVFAWQLGTVKPPPRSRLVLVRRISVL